MCFTVGKYSFYWGSSGLCWTNILCRKYQKTSSILKFQVVSVWRGQNFHPNICLLHTSLEVKLLLHGTWHGAKTRLRAGVVQPNNSCGQMGFAAMLL